MATTPILGLTYMVSGQAQKEVTHNAALNDIDYLAKLSVLDTALATPPASPTTGDTYIVGASPTGAWAGYANYIAAYYAGWVFKAPQAGWVAWSRAASRLIYYNGSAWVLLDTPKLDGTLTWAPGSVATGGGTTSAAIAVTGAALGDFVSVAAPYDLQGVMAVAYVNAANSAVIRLVNVTGAAVTLASGSWRVRVTKL